MKEKTGGGLKDGVQVEWHDAGMHDDVYLINRLR